MEDGTLQECSLSFPKQGTLSGGRFSMPHGSVFPNIEKEYSLSELLEENPNQEYFLSQRVVNRLLTIESELNAQNRLSAVIQSKKQYARVYDSNGISPTLHRHTGGGQITKIAIPVLTPNREEKRQNGRRMKDDGEPVFTLTKADRNGIYDGRRIRYLTPLECERLMGWPDNWTAHGIDEKGNTVEMSDNQRYNLIGNGVVPQVVSGIIKEALK